MIKGVNIFFVFVMIRGWSGYDLRWTSTADDIWTVNRAW